MAPPEYTARDGVLGIMFCGKMFPMAAIIMEINFEFLNFQTGKA